MSLVYKKCDYFICCQDRGQTPNIRDTKVFQIVDIWYKAVNLTILWENSRLSQDFQKRTVKWNSGQKLYSIIFGTLGKKTKENISKKMRQKLIDQRCYFLACDAMNL